MESLALKYRPHNFDDLVGQRSVQVILRQMVLKDKVPSALLFDGPRGTGKTTTARILAAALNCETSPGPCGHCPSCKAVFDGTSLDVVEIDAASNGLADDMRQLCSQVMYRVSGTHRIVILDEAHSASNQGFNVFLKTLEQPPLDTVFILCTTEPGRIPDTVISRCMPFTFRRIGLADIVDRLTTVTEAERLNVAPELLTLIAERADGGLRDAVMTFDQITRVGINTVEEFTDLFGGVDIAPELLRHLTAANTAAAYQLTDDAMSRSADALSLVSGLTRLLKEILILKSGGTLTKTGHALHRRAELAEAMDTPVVVAAMRVLWDLKTKVRVSDDPRGTLDLAVALIGELFARRNQPPPTAPPPALPRKLSLAEMAARR